MPFGFSDMEVYGDQMEKFESMEEREARQMGVG